MSKYAWRGKPLEALTREELLEALVQALDRVAELEEPPSIWLSPERRAQLQHQKNLIASSRLNALHPHKPE